MIIVIGILALAFCINSCSKKNDNKSDNTRVAGKNENTKADNSEMTVAGYALGEIPPIPIPDMPNLSVTENPGAKITLDMTKKISSVPGIVITPVKVENSTIVGEITLCRLGKTGKVS